MVMQDASKRAMVFSFGGRMPLGMGV